MAQEILTFTNYDLTRPHENIYEIGSGVVPEIAQAFGHTLATQQYEQDLGELIGVVGPAKELQENIGLVQERLGKDNRAVDIARGWVERSGLLTAVDRPYLHAGELPETYEIAVITGGVRNWMQRRANVLDNVSDANVNKVLLAAGNRTMKPVEGEDVEEGMTEADYMENVIAQPMADKGYGVDMLRVDSAIGNEVALAVAEYLGRLAGAKLLVLTNAGNWVQNAGQLRRAIRKEDSAFDEHGNQLFVVSDTFPLGTGVEPISTHQNPFSALGIILKNAQELVRHP